MKHFTLLLGVLLCTTVMFAQRTITGVVADDNGEALIGATILLEGSTIGTVTDFDGSYSLDVPTEGGNLVFTYTGYTTKTIPIEASNIIDVVLQEGVALQEVVVTGLGISREKKSLGYAVQELDGDDIANTKEVNIVNSLQGKIAGVQIQGTNSSMGGSSRITIRGSNSFLGDNQPLFIIDGVPIVNQGFSDNSQQTGFGGADAYDYGNTAQDIDPNSIKSMSVLKGAAATAIYGQRGANGVILITTKDGRGQKKGIGVEINSSVAINNVANLLPHQQEYGGGAINSGTSHGFNEVIQDGTTYLYPAYSKDGSWGPKYDPSVLVRHWDSWDPNSSEYKVTRPWVAPNSGYEDYFETGVSLNNSISLTGANDKGSFRLGYSNLNETGTFPEARQERNSLSFNSRYELHERVKVGISGNYIRTDAENRNATGYNNGNPMQAFTQWWQTQLDLDRLKNAYRSDGTQATWNAVGPQLDADGNLLSFTSRPNFFDNPYWVRENYLQEDVRNRFFGNANVEVELAKGLVLGGRFGTDFYQFSLQQGIPNASVETGFYTEIERRFQETNLEATLRYNTNFGKVSMNALVGGNSMRQLFRRIRAETTGGLSLDEFYNIQNSAGVPNVNTFERQKGINSLFGTLSFGWDNWAYLDLTARNDISSTLPEDNNSYFYPSASLSFVITDMPFIENLNVISFAKVRVSYAQVGLDAQEYGLVDVFSPETPNFGSEPRFKVPQGQNNPILKPELTNEFEIGADLQFLKGRIALDMAYFDRTSKDQIFSVPSSPTTGYTSRLLNAGEMRNWGFELQLNGTPIQTKDFAWNIGVNLFRQNNEVVELAEGVENIARGSTWAADLRIAKGLPYMAIFGNDYTYHENGERLVNDQGEYIFSDSRVYLGSAIADWTGGFNTSFNYKGITASALFDFQVGGSIHSTSLQWAKYSGMHPETVSFNGEDDIRANGLLLPGVTADGTPNTQRIDPQAYYQTYWNRAAPNLYKADFLKLREVRLGYNIPAKLFKGTFINGINVSLFGRNLAVLSADLPYLDPQVITGPGNDQGLENAQIPPVRTFGANVNIKF